MKLFYCRLRHTGLSMYAALRRERKIFVEGERKRNGHALHAKKSCSRSGGGFLLLCLGAFGLWQACVLRWHNAFYGILLHVELLLYAVKGVGLAQWRTCLRGRGSRDLQYNTAAFYRKRLRYFYDKARPFERAACFARLLCQRAIVVLSTVRSVRACTGFGCDSAR